jgi:hypothetical protein
VVQRVNQGVCLHLDDLLAEVISPAPRAQVLEPLTLAKVEPLVAIEKL